MIETGTTRILDLGVGHGGNYLEPKRRGTTLFVGVDTFRRGLEDTKRNYGIDVVLANAFKLPFADCAFNRVQMYYPHDSIFLGLTRADSGLWQELGRVLTPSGEVSVVFDIYPLGYRRITVNGAITDIDRPISKIGRAARSSQFSVSINTVGTDFLFMQVGTNYGKLAAYRFRHDKNHKTHHLHAVKK